MDNGTIDIETRIINTMDAVKMAWWEMELPSGVIFFDKNKAQMIGRNPDEFVHYSHFTKLVHKEDYDKVMKSMSEYLEGRSKIYECVYRIQHKDGRYRKFFDRGKVIQRDGAGNIKLMGIVLDITSVNIDCHN